MMTIPIGGHKLFIDTWHRCLDTTLHKTKISLPSFGSSFTYSIYSWNEANAGIDHAGEGPIVIYNPTVLVDDRLRAMAIPPTPKPVAPCPGSQIEWDMKVPRLLQYVMGVT